MKAARKEEVSFMQSKPIWEIVPESKCWALSGKGPVSVKWVDTDKGDPGNPMIRSRLVARDFKGEDKDRDDLFAGTPPLEATNPEVEASSIQSCDPAALPHSLELHRSCSPLR